MSTATFDATAYKTAAGGIEPLVEPDWIASHLADPDVRMVEVDVSPVAFEAGHIAGAVFWNAYGDLRPVEYRPISAEALSALITRSGIAPETVVVFYGYAAYLGYWVLRSHGHSRVCLMDGPRDRWAQAGHAWTPEAAPASAAESTPYPVGLASDDLITREAVHELIGDPDTLLLDVRSREEYAGECFWPSGASQEGGRAGHLPGAVHVAADLVRGADGELRDVEALRDLYAAARVSPERQIVVYCTIGNRASQVWYLLKHLLGYPRVSVYYGSWAEWGTMEGLPVQTGTDRS